MVHNFDEKPVDNFQDFEQWLEKNNLFDNDILYRGQPNSVWRLKARFIGIDAINYLPVG